MRTPEQSLSWSLQWAWWADTYSPESDAKALHLLDKTAFSSFFNQVLLDFVCENVKCKLENVQNK
jgi:hypothetical protein